MIGAKRRPLVPSRSSPSRVRGQSRGYPRSLLTFNRPRHRGVPRGHHGRGASGCALASVSGSSVLLSSSSFLLLPPLRHQHRGVARGYHGRGASGCALTSVGGSSVLLSSSSFLLFDTSIALLVTTMGDTLPVARSRRSGAPTCSCRPCPSSSTAPSARCDVHRAAGGRRSHRRPWGRRGSRASAREAVGS
jgi:hypothetical protein